ncbi:helicase RepA family protein [Rhizobium sp. NPDC090275]|uniref:helicase RepA family protein n=1 Tax=Rhizobium sp. NPDC090275 TaxID=3364498 RepID=UPI00383A885B
MLDFSDAEHEAYWAYLAVAADAASNDASYTFPHDNVSDFATERQKLKSGTPAPAGGNPSFKFSGFTYEDPAGLERRPWLYGHHLLRKYVSATLAPGGVGKSTLTITDALSMVTGRALLGSKPREQHLLVCIWNGEDDAIELKRRVLAVMLHYDISPAEIEGRLFLTSGRDMPIKISNDKQQIAVPVIDALIETINSQRIDVLIIDPFVSIHGLPENDNGAMDAAIKAFALVADRTNCAIEIVHHSRKLNGIDADIDSARGGSALAGAVRAARVLNAMNAETAGKLGIAENERRSYVRIDDAKGNFAPPEAAKWFKLVSEPLGNHGPNNEPGDWVAVAKPWVMPDMAAGLSADDLTKVQDAVEYQTHNGVEQCRLDAQATSYVGHTIARVLKLDMQKDRDKARVKAAVKKWIEEGSLIVVRGPDGKSKDRDYVHVGKRATNPRD